MKFMKEKIPEKIPIVKDIYKNGIGQKKTSSQKTVVYIDLYIIKIRQA